ncbi:hypothetical protein [Halorubrum sp. AJ67]|uniref:hypothetical protein n=1 Tax=Halorubrum sp. AJ67 TaxID=1173487 RepID=UPI0003DC4408|nr:hypothetical protein [Halorubrum sp. AJ67]CDK41028.1 putative signal peptide protein [Halorubrum sp. AJ67]
MYRRSLLVALTPALAGCSLTPTGPLTESYPTSAPNVFASFDWDPDRSVLIVTFDRGNRLTAENTGRLSVITPDPEGVETVWVDRDDTDTASEFPLTPGATLHHEISAPATTHVVWEGPEQQNSQAVGNWRPEMTRSEGGE